jgi:hypothetical protein
MPQPSYSLHQVSMGLLHSALSLEYYISDEFGDIYEDEKANRLIWTKSFTELLNWSLEESFELGLHDFELETWGDAVIFEDFKPIAEKLLEENQMLGGKLVFLVLALCYVLELYLNLPNALGVENITLLQSQLKIHLREKWKTDLDSGMINPELNSFHIPMAKDFAQRWQNRLGSLVDKAS